MSFDPTIPLSGLSGFRFLERTFDRQTELFNRDPQLNRAIAHFEEVAAGFETAEDLVADSQALKVVLGAFGLDEDADKPAFIRKVLEEGTIDPGAFANRLVTPEYREMAAFVGFGDLGGRLGDTSVQADITARYRERQFELAVGETDVDLRLALNFQREAAAIADRTSSDDAKWFSILGSPPLRQVLEGAFNLPGEFVQLDLDQQLQLIEDRSARFLGSESPSVLSDPDKMQTVVERFLLNQQIENGVIGSNVPGSTALTLLQSSGLGGAARNNLFVSLF